MRMKVGNKVIFTNIKRIRDRKKYKLQEDSEYVVIGIDQQDGCPYVVVNDLILYTSKSELKYIEVREAEPLPLKEFEQLLLKFPYIPKSKTILHLIEQFEEQNENRWVNLAIDNALSEKNFVLLEKLLKLKKENRKNNQKEDRE